MKDKFVIRDYSNLPEADNQSIPQQPLILSGYSENMQGNAQQPLLDPQHSLDMQQTSAQQPSLDPWQPSLDPDMQQTSARHL